MKPVLKAPGSVLLKLRYDGPLSDFAFNFNLSRYDMASETPEHHVIKISVRDTVGRFRLTLSNPRCNRLELSA
jgi:hypothetical protein